MLAYSFQIYFDFSGYSDMAIGLGRMFGIEFLENFDRPYLSRTFTEFWQRWHISLSRFMRDYLFLPLGGNRRGPIRGYANLWIVFLLSGLWHGAAWTFVVWGAYQGLFLSLDRLFWGRVALRLPRLITVPINFLLLNIGWAFFRAADLEGALAFLGRLFVAGRAGGGERTLADGARPEPPRPGHDGRGGPHLLPARRCRARPGPSRSRPAGTSRSAWCRRPSLGLGALRAFLLLARELRLQPLHLLPLLNMRLVRPLLIGAFLLLIALPGLQMRFRFVPEVALSGVRVESNEAVAHPGRLVAGRASSRRPRPGSTITSGSAGTRCERTTRSGCPCSTRRLPRPWIPSSWGAG